MYVPNHPPIHLCVVDQGCRQITISISAPQGTLEQDILTIDVGPDMTIADLKAYIQSDTNVDPAAQGLFHNGQELRDDMRTLQQCQIKEKDMLGMLVRSPRAQAAGARAAGQPQSSASPQAGRRQGGQRATGRDDPEMHRLHALADPSYLNTLRSHAPELADAVHDQGRFQQAWEAMVQQADQGEAEKQGEIARLNEDPFNIEAQAKIEEIIRQQAVQENLQHAFDHTPEG